MNIKSMYGMVRLNQIETGLPLLKQLGLGAELVMWPEELFFPHARVGCFLPAGQQLPERCIMHLPFYGLQLGGRNRFVRELSVKQITLAIQLCGKLGINKAVLHPAFSPLIPTAGHHGWYQSFADSLAQILPIARQNEVTIMAENTWEHTPEMFLKMADDFSELCFCLDIAHVYCFSTTPLSDWLSAFGQKLLHVHLSDNNQAEDCHWGLGKGHLDFSVVPQQSGLTYTLETAPEEWESSLAHLRSLKVLT